MQPTIYRRSGKRFLLARACFLLWLAMPAIGVDRVCASEDDSAIAGNNSGKAVIELGTAPDGKHEVRIVGLAEQQVASLERLVSGNGEQQTFAWRDLFQVRVGKTVDGRIADVKAADDKAADDITTDGKIATSQDDLPPIIGGYQTTSDGAVFRPRFPLRANVMYVVEFGFTNQRDYLRREVSFDEDSGPPTTVTQIYPSSEVLPENLLRFYVEFSAPMRRGNIYRYIELLDDQGMAVELPFLEIEQELWGRDGRRLMLLLDPGRVKRGLKPRIDAGPALVANRRYELRIDASWPDANGRELQSAASKRFRVAKADEVCPSPRDWRIHRPIPETRGAVVVEFGEPLDAAMLQRVIAIVDGDDREIAGTVSTTNNETEWHFQPQLDWSEGKYFVRVSTALEDLAGNSIAKPFEVNVNTRPNSDGQPSEMPQFTKLPFEISL